MKQVTAGSRSLVSKSKCLLPFVQVQILDVYMIFFYRIHTHARDKYVSIYLFTYLSMYKICMLYIDIRRYICFLCGCWHAAW